MNDLQPQVLVGLLTLTIVVLVRLRPRPLRRRRLIIGPCVVTAVGALVLAPSLATTATWSLGATVAVGVADLALTVGLGIARGATVQVGTARGDGSATGQVEYRYTAATVALWAVSVALRFELAVKGAQWDAAPAVTEGSVLFALGISLLTQNLVVVRAGARERARVDKSELPDRAKSSNL